MLGTRLVAQAIAALLLALIPCRAMAAVDQPLLLDVLINGYTIGKIGDFVLRDGVLLASRDELKNLGLALPSPAAASARSADLIPLAGIPGLGSRINQSTQTVYITASNDRLTPTLLHFRHDDESMGSLESGTGATLDYDAFGTSASGRAFADALIDLRVFSPRGVASTGVIVRGGSSGANWGGSSRIVRLDTSYTVSDVARLRRYRFGDFITGALDWTRSIRLAGIQVASDFGLRPDLVTFPVPSIAGSVAVPSTIDVLVNGTRQFEGDVQAGPFRVDQLPVVNGAGTVSTRITNALGSQVVTNLPFYASVSLLKPGLQAYSMQVGTIRRDWGSRSNSYGEIAAMGSYRRGLSRRLTVDATAEATGGLLMGGGGVVINVADIALMNVAGAASRSQAGTGAELAIGIQHSSPIFTLAASMIVAGPRFRDVAASQGDAIARRQYRANAGMTLGRLGSVGIAFAGLDRAPAQSIRRFFLPKPQSSDTLSLSPDSFLPVTRARLVSSSYSAQWRSLSFYLTGFRDFAQHKSGGIALSLTLPLGRRSSASATTASGSGGSRLQLQANRTPITIGDWGYQLAAASGPAGSRFGEIRYRSSFSELSAGVDGSGGGSAIRIGARGSLSLIDGGVFASNSIPDSFAVVDTGGVKDVRVLYENREVGRTDAHGRLLVPDLRSFNANHLSVDPLDVPLDISIGAVTKIVRPFDRSGIIVRFPMAASRAALVRLVDLNGKALPLGSTATLRGTGTAVPVGYDGAAYIENLGETNVLVVELPNATHCAANFAYHPAKGAIAEVGPLTCRERGI